MESQHENQFLTMLPQIEKRANHAFSAYGSEQREEYVAEVVANCWRAFCRLVDRDLADTAYATPLAQFAICQVRDGRRVGNPLNCNDATSDYCKQRKGVSVSNVGAEALALLPNEYRDDPADVVAARIDVGEWFATLRDDWQLAAQLLASGETTGATAAHMNKRPAHISRLRRALADNWTVFQGPLAMI